MSTLQSSNPSGLATQDHKLNLREKFKRSISGPGGTISLGLILIITVSSIWVGSMTFSSSNISLLLGYLAIPLIVGVFASFSLLAGVVDLSIGGMVALSATSFAYLCATGLNKWLAAVLAILICLGFGALNGVAIVVFGANPIAATLGMLVGIRGLARIIARSAPNPTGSHIRSVNDAIPMIIPGLNNFVLTSLSFVPILFIGAFVLTMSAQSLISFTKAGRHIRAVGGDITAARRAGLHTERIKFMALLASAFGASLAGILYVGQLGSAPVTAGNHMEFSIYAALMIGGYSILRGGVGNPTGGFVGLLIIATFSNFVDNKGIDVRAADIFVGFLLIFVVYLDVRRGGDAFE